MKKIILLILSFFVLVPSTYAFTLPQGWEQLTQNVFQKWTDKQPSNMIENKLGALETRIASKRTSYKSIPDVLKLIDYLLLLIDNHQDLIQKNKGATSNSQSTNNEPKVSNNSTTNTSNNPIINDNSTTDSRLGFKPGSQYIEGEQIILGGDKKQIVAEFELIANRESIRLEDISVIASTEIVGYIDTIYVYDEDGDLVGFNSPTNNKASLLGIHYLLEQGSTKFYVLVDTKTLGWGSQNVTGTNISFRLQVDEAKGYTSNSKLSVQSIESSDTITLQQVKIEAVNSLDQYEGYQVDSYLSNGVENILGIFEIRSQYSNNQQTYSPSDPNIAIHQLTFKVNQSTNLINGQVFLRRIDSSSQPISSTINGNSVTFSLTTADLFEIENGESALFAISAFPIINANNVSAQFILGDLDQGAIIYSINERNATRYSKLLLPYSEVRGNKIID